MKSKLWLLAMFLLVLPSVSAMLMNNTILNATGNNLAITITYQWNLSQATIYSDSIYIENLSTSHPSSTSFNDTITFNMTESNKSYTGLQVPYFSTSTNVKKVITSDIAEDLDGSVFFQTDYCAVQSINYIMADGTQKNYNSSEWACSGNIIELNFTNLGTGTNTFFINNFVITNCTAGNKSLNFVIYDEDSPTSRLTANVEAEIYYWRTPDHLENFTLEFSGANNYSICLNPNSTSIQADIYFKYNTTNGFTHRYYLFNTTLNSTVQNHSLYNLDTTTDVSDLKVTVRQDANYRYYPEILGKLQRKYPAEGVWRTVQMDLSGDYGLIFFNIWEENIDYRLIFTDKQNCILKTTDTMKFVCTSGICDITFLLDPCTAVSTATGFSASFPYDPDTGNITTTWSDSLGAEHTVRILVQKNTYTGILDICDVTQTGSSGSHNCAVSGHTGVVEYSLSDNGEVVVKKLYDLNATKLGILVGNDEGAVWAIGIILTSAMFGLFSPVGAIIATVFGVIVVYFLGIFTPITATFVIIVSIAGVVIGFKLKN